MRSSDKTEWHLHALMRSLSMRSKSNERTGSERTFAFVCEKFFDAERNVLFLTRSEQLHERENRGGRNFGQTQAGNRNGKKAIQNGFDNAMISRLTVLSEVQIKELGSGKKE